MQALGRQLSDLAKQYNDALHDLEGERAARRHAQQRAEAREKKFTDLEESTVRAMPL
jgi:Arc/MetJ family transcription regulator